MGCHDLNAVQENLSASYILANDVDCNITRSWDGGKGFTPIGNDINSFSGLFDGNGHTISNLYINRSTQDYVGLVGYTHNATIRNLGLIDVNITGHNYVGALIGHLDNYTTISNNYSTGQIIGNLDIGGLVGESYGNILSSYSLCNSHSLSEAMQ